MARQMITDDIWEKLKRRLPRRKGRPGNDDRNFLEEVCWMVKTGPPWRDLPPEYGAWKTIYNRYQRWARRGYLDELLAFSKKRYGCRMAHD